MVKRNWPQLGREIVEKLQSENDSERIAAIGQEAIALIQGHDKPENALKSVSRQVLKAFPRELEEKPNYYYDSGGKGDLLKWRHLIFRTLTLDPVEGRPTAEVVSRLRVQDSVSHQALYNFDKRKAYKMPKPTRPLMVDDEITVTIALNDQLKEALRITIEQTGQTLDAIAAKALEGYCKSIAHKSTEPIETISTEALLTEDRYKTLPGRGEELTKRAIKAIQIYNESAYGDVKPWAITQSAISRLTGAKPTAIKRVLKDFNSYDYNQSKGIDGYTNRSIPGDIVDYINLAELVSDGLPD
ncbi:MAG: hypothetical protein SAJ12_06785 [Jaaginema sp. PMC 1079.18]|nr:hypothetical protein [Jaaginema sp. PMC 1080.18]MEC4850700.1 hypothetical protein [Jaaginema sp. PMC 1079.18]MEC4866765.1 hypothetical protein [Jaaginema sp. PMC 1078.18]